MTTPLKILGLIPARGDSKGIPLKNIVPLGGRPLIAYTLAAARAARHLTRCIVSTDAARIRALCLAEGADVPFLRPPELARDNTPTMPVVLHALDALAEAYDAVMILQPTTPFRTAADIDRSIELLVADPTADSVISVVKVEDKHPVRMKRIEDGVLVDLPWIEDREGQPRQSLPECFLRNGAIYLTRTSVLREQKLFRGKRSLAYIMPAERSINIDHRLDLLLAEAVLKEGLV